MKRIDFYVQHLVRHGATEVVLGSGQPVLFRFPDGERKSSAPIEHAQVAELIQESAPLAAATQLRKSGKAAFVHTAEDGGIVHVRVHARAADIWLVSLTPAQDQTPPSSPGRAAAADPAGAPGGPAQAQAVRPAGGARIDRWLRRVCEINASDLHLSTGVVPMIRHDGEMQLLEERGPLTEEELAPILMEIIPPRNRKEFEETNDTDFAYTLEGLSRFRVNYFRDRKGIGAAMRQIPYEILSPEQLGLPLQVLDLCFLTKGLVLVTGPTGCGKSTTLATLVDIVNQKRPDHIVTIEDPIEFVHKNKRCLVNQREVGTHTASFKKALRAALREDPDVVVVGELRDLETIAIAIETAETGHLVFGTLHTTTAPSTIDRIIDQFPADRQEQIRTMLSESLRGVISQMLCKRKGGGRVAAYEVLIANSAVGNLIREGKTFQLISVMQTGKNIGMQTMNEHLFHHLQNGLITAEEAYLRSNDKKDMLERFERASIPFTIG